MTKKVLLLGKTPFEMEDWKAELADYKIELFSGTSINDVKNAFETHPMDMVIMGAGIEIEVRLQIIKHIFSVSNATTVHLKDWDSGKDGMKPFVHGVLKGIVGLS